MNDEQRRTLSVYVTLEPCLMCGSALSFVGIKRIVYAALAEDANAEQMIVRNLTLAKINDQLVRGPFILVPGVRRGEGRALLRHPVSLNQDDLKLRIRRRLYPVITGWSRHNSVHPRARVALGLADQEQTTDQLRFLFTLA